jgi:hypothetical protein
VTSLLSFHQLRDWLCCPQLYAYKHLHMLPDYQHQAEQERGELLHKLIAQASQGQSSQPPPDLVELWQNYLNCIAPFREYPSHSEWSYFFQFKTEGMSWGIHGRFDLLVYLPDSLLIIDWKTGSHSLTDSWQMEWYAWCCHRLRSALKIGADLPIQTQCVYLKEGRTQKVLFQPTELEKHEEEFSKHIAQLNPKEYAFIPNPHSWQQGSWCERCTYQEICPEGIRYCHERADFAV